MGLRLCIARFCSTNATSNNTKLMISAVMRDRVTLSYAERQEKLFFVFKWKAIHYVVAESNVCALSRQFKFNGHQWQIVFTPFPFAINAIDTLLCNIHTYKILLIVLMNIRFYNFNGKSIVRLGHIRPLTGNSWIKNRVICMGDLWYETRSDKCPVLPR